MFVITLYIQKLCELLKIKFCTSSVTICDSFGLLTLATISPVVFACFYRILLVFTDQHPAAVNWTISVNTARQLTRFFFLFFFKLHPQRVIDPITGGAPSPPTWFVFTRSYQRTSPSRARHQPWATPVGIEPTVGAISAPNPSVLPLDHLGLELKLAVTLRDKFPAHRKK